MLLALVHYRFLRERERELKMNNSDFFLLQLIFLLLIFSSFSGWYILINII